MAERIELILDGAVMQEEMDGPDGLVMQHLIRRADAIIAAARIQLEPHRKTGRLAASIVKRPGVSPWGPKMTIMAGAGLRDPDYSYWVHEGNGPPGGRIYPQRAKVLAWVTSGERPGPKDRAGWQAARASGRAVIARSVRTSKPIHYLTDNLRIAVE